MNKSESKVQRINDIKIDYKKGILSINEEQVTTPVIVKVREPDGWDIAKLFNPNPEEKRSNYPTLVLDAREVYPGRAEKRSRDTD